MSSDQEPSPLQEGQDVLAVNLKRARLGQGLSVREVHERTGISPAVLYGYESGKTKPGARELTLICHALHVTPNVLLFDTEDPFGPAETTVDRLLRMTDSKVAGVMVGLMLFPMITLGLDRESKRTLFSVALTMLKASDPDIARKVVANLDAMDEVLQESDLDWDSMAKLDKEAQARVLGLIQQRVEEKLKK